MYNGFGRVGSSFATVEFGVTPAIITCAKGLTGGVICHPYIFQAMEETAHRSSRLHLLLQAFLALWRCMRSRRYSRTRRHCLLSSESCCVRVLGSSGSGADRGMADQEIYLWCNDDDVTILLLAVD
mmetsp:Transcript_11452/g.15772  ORF Transcript_11452/g.15772 Transcript_11452/m.15772 type:complete len:126 (-) Transcript_11452:152-529(-)